MRRRRLVIAAITLVALGLASTATPVQADPLPDAYTQLVNHQIPIQPDGKPTYGPNGWYRYYTGPNGLEIRFSNDASWNVIVGIFKAEMMGSGFVLSNAISTMLAGVITIRPAAIKAASVAAGLGENFVDDAAHRALLNGKCLGITLPDGLGGNIERFLNRGAWLMSGQLYQAFNGPYFDDARVWIENCTPASVGPLSDRIPTVQMPFIDNVLGAQQINYTADRTILHGSNGTLYVMAGGAKFAFGSWNEFVNLGYSTNGMISLDDATMSTIPNVPRNGTVLRSGGGQLYTVASGAKFPFGSMAEYYGQGYSNNAWVNVPQAPLNAIGDAPGNLPQDGAVIKHPDGRLFIVVGGVKFQFGSMNEFSNLGYSTGQITYVSGAPTDAIPSASTATPPSNGTILRSGGGQIYAVSGGAKFHFGTLAEFHSQGYADGSWYNVPQAPLDLIGDVPGNMPRNGTVVLRPDGTLFVIAGGVRWQFGTMAEFASEGYDAFTLVSQSAIDGIADASASHLPADETVVQGTGVTIWVMKSGQRRSFASMTQFASLEYSTGSIVRVPDGVLSGIPDGGPLP
jgi:hypothetical protein